MGREKPMFDPRVKGAYTNTHTYTHTHTHTHTVKFCVTNEKMNNS
jgi:hypothetical protein